MDGFCGKSNSEVKITFDVRTAYYYDSEEFLKNFMIEKFDADVYNPDSENDFDALTANLTNYGLVVIEHPLLPASSFNNKKEDFEDYVSDGGLLMLSGQITSSQGGNMLGVEYYKKSGQSESDRNATINQTDEYLTFQVGENIVFSQAYYTVNTSSSQNFKALVRFNEDNNIAISRWNYDNGSVYYFSDFDATYFSGDFAQSVQDATLSWVGGNCIVNISNAGIINLVKTNRLLTYTNAGRLDITKMVLYLWS